VFLLYVRYVKRILDVVFAFIGLIMLSPLFLLLAVIIKLDSPGPVFFKQKRVGIHKTYFNIIKFRTMRMGTPQDIPTHMLEDPSRWLSRVGKVLRKYSCDELSQLLNILFMQMSFVGPRPALWNQDDLVAERDKYGANDVLPGLTGWAQINGRDELPIEVKARYDGEYVRKMGFWFDVRCFVRTIFNVVRKDGVTH